METTNTMQLSLCIFRFRQYNKIQVRIGIFSDNSPLPCSQTWQLQRLSVLVLGAAMANKVEGFNFEQRHGKSRVRVARVWKSKEGRYFFVEWNVSISLLSDCVASYVRDDNSDIVATDTMKNTVWFGFTFIFSLDLYFFFNFCLIAECIIWAMVVKGA